MLDLESYLSTATLQAEKVENILFHNECQKCLRVA